MRAFSIYVPAKAMLFGEYGVLYGFPAAALTFFKYYFHLDLVLTPYSSTGARLRVKSPFFEPEENNTLFIELEKAYPPDSNEHFFKSILLPYADKLVDFNIQIEVKHCFSPSLGFGSSSALISGIHRVLFQAFYGDSFVSSPLFWDNLFKALYAIQKRGSGYDICLQALNSQFSAPSKKNVKFYQYKKTADTIPFWEEFLPPQPNGLGLFLATGVYSSTKIALQKNSREAFAEAHGHLALDFFKDMKTENIKNLMKTSIAISEQHQIIPPLSENSSFSIMCDRLKKLDLPFKTMGSGYGDCIWVLGHPSSLPSVNHPVLPTLWQNAVVFDFGKDC